MHEDYKRKQGQQNEDKTGMNERHINSFFTTYNTLTNQATKIHNLKKENGESTMDENYKRHLTSNSLTLFLYIARTMTSTPPFTIFKIFPL